MAAGTTQEADAAAGGVAGEVEEHPNRDWLYIKTAIVLAVVTALEVLAHVIPDVFGGEGSIFFVGWLLFWMGVKFWYVVWVFMHLKWEKPLLTWVFYAGAVLAVAVYIGMMTMFRIWGGMS